MNIDSSAAFVSYSREDLEFARRLATDLKKAGATVWMDKLDILPGQLWEHMIEEALTSCSRMLVILSPASVASKNVMAEVSFALDEHKEIIPVLYKACRIPFRLRPIQYVDFRKDEDYSSELLELLRTVSLERPDQEATPALGQPQESVQPQLEKRSSAATAWVTRFIHLSNNHLKTRFLLPLALVTLVLTISSQVSSTSKRPLRPGFASSPKITQTVFNSPVSGSRLSGVHTEDDAILSLLDAEGGFFSNPANGYASNFGITRDELSRFEGHSVSVEEMRDLTKAEAIKIYKSLYLTGAASGLASVRVKAAYLNLSKFTGNANADSFFRAAVSKIDRAPAGRNGTLDSETVQRINAVDSELLIEIANCEAAKHLEDEISKHPGLIDYRRGWLQRLRSFSPLSLRGICTELQASSTSGAAKQ